jgi:hypothetical protein
MSRLPHFRLIAQNFVPLVAGSNTIAEDRPRSVVSFVPQLFRLLAEKLRALIFAKPSETDNAKSSATINGTYPGQSKLTCTPALNAVRRIQPAKLAASYVPLHAKKAEPYGCSVSAVRVLQRFEAVYALQVAGNPVFYANGILVHNCDAMTLALARVRKGGLLSLRTDNEDNEPVFFRRKGGYY